MMTILMPSLALYQPEIPQNTGTLMRLCACLDVQMHLIHPLGFALSDKKMKRAGMDYVEHLKKTDHLDFDQFVGHTKDVNSRIVLATTKGDVSFTQFNFAPTDVILMGRETAGVPEHVHEQADARVIIPMHHDMRSINMAVSASMILSEALRQTDGFNL